MTRLEALEAVAEAARTVLRERLGTDAAAWEVACARLDAALATLDAHREAPQETVTLAVWRDPSDGEVKTVIPNGSADADFRRMNWQDLGTVTLPITQEGGR